MKKGLVMEGGMTESIPLKTFEDMGYEKNPDELQRVYELGRSEMQKKLSGLKEFLK